MSEKKIGNTRTKMNDTIGLDVKYSTVRNSLGNTHLLTLDFCELSDNTLLIYGSAFK